MTEKSNQRVITVIGTRPEIIKLSRLVPLLDNSFDHEFVFTSQHYSREMVDIFFDEMDLRKPDEFLQVRSSNYADIEKAILSKLKGEKGGTVITYGDTNSTLAAARIAKSLGMKVVHIEAGLRSFDERMLEESNRIETDRISDILFPPTELAKQFLVQEKVGGKIFVVGNMIVDAYNYYSKKLKKNGLKEEIGEYFLLTAHRAENVDDPGRLLQILDTIKALEKKVVFPIHPRTEKRIKDCGYTLPENAVKMGPLGYLDFLSILRDAELVLTDSGGVQEEAILSHVPCLTMRESTERWETIINRGSFLTGLNPRINSNYARMVVGSELGDIMRNAENPYGDGKTSEKIVEILKREIE